MQKAPIGSKHTERKSLSKGLVFTLVLVLVVVVVIAVLGRV